MKTPTIVTHILPAYWASYIVNDDASSLDSDELSKINAWLKSHRLAHCPAGCGDEYIGRFGGVIACVCEFTFLT